MTRLVYASIPSIPKPTVSPPKPPPCSDPENSQAHSEKEMPSEEFPALVKTEESKKPDNQPWFPPPKTVYQSTPSTSSTCKDFNLTMLSKKLNKTTRTNEKDSPSKGSLSPTPEHQEDEKADEELQDGSCANKEDLNGTGIDPHDQE